MDTRNVIAAISLSAAVIILYSLFFQPDPATIKKNLAEQNKIENNEDTPSLDKNENFAKLSRTEALKENDAIPTLEERKKARTFLAEKKHSKLILIMEQPTNYVLLE